MAERNEFEEFAQRLFDDVLLPRFGLHPSARHEVSGWHQSVGRATLFVFESTEDIFCDYLRWDYPKMMKSNYHLLSYVTAYGLIIRYNYDCTFRGLLVVTAFILQTVIFCASRGRPNLVRCAEKCWIKTFEDFKDDFLKKGGWEAFKAYIMSEDFKDCDPAKDKALVLELELKSSKSMFSSKAKKSFREMLASNATPPIDLDDLVRQNLLHFFYALRIFPNCYKMLSAEHQTSPEAASKDLTRQEEASHQSAMCAEGMDHGASASSSGNKGARPKERSAKASQREMSTDSQTTRTRESIIEELSSGFNVNLSGSLQQLEMIHQCIKIRNVLLGRGQPGQSSGDQSRTENLEPSETASSDKTSKEESK